MSALSSFELDDLKLIYRVLHAHLIEHTDLMDSQLFGDLQQLLFARASAAGVELADHAAWDAWLGTVNPISCDERMKGRRTL